MSASIFLFEDKPDTEAVILIAFDAIIEVTAKIIKHFIIKKLTSYPEKAYYWNIASGATIFRFCVDFRNCQGCAKSDDQVGYKKAVG